MALREAFIPRTVCLSATNVWEEKTVPSGVKFIRFVSVDGNVAVRIAASGDHFMTFSVGFSSFEIPIREGETIEIRGENGGEKIRMFVR